MARPGKDPYSILMQSIATPPQGQTASYLVPTLAWFALITAGTIGMSLVPMDWTTWAPATCMPHDCFCEGIREGTVRQPANTFSNLAFVFAGLVVIFRARADARGKLGPANLITREPAYAWAYGIAMLVTGLGSVYYHASLTFLGQFFDVMGMYLLGGFIVLYGAQRMTKLSGSRFLALYIVLNVLLCIALWYVPVFRRWLFAALIVGALVIEIYARKLPGGKRDMRYFWAALGLLAVSFGIWNLDIRHIVCVPESLVQGHAVWHLLDAASAFCLYLYYRSETSAPAT